MSETAAPPTPRTQPGASHSWRWPLAALAAAVVASHLPLAALHLRSLWQRQQYQFFPFVLAAFAGLLVVRYREATPRTKPHSNWPPRLLLAASALLLAAAVVLLSAWVAFIALLVAAAGLLALLGRDRRIENLWGVWALLWLLVPLPLGQDERFTRYLQRLSSQMSSWVLDWLGVLHLLNGNVVTLPDRELFVDEACSGIISVMSVIAVSAIYAVWRRRSLLHLALLAAAGVGWALVLNVVRICTIAVALDRFDVDLTAGAPHELLSLALFAVTFGALISTDVLLAGLLAPAEPEQLGLPVRYGRNWLVRLWNQLVDRPFTRARTTATDASQAAAPQIATAAPAWRGVLVASALFLALGVAQFLWAPSVDTAQARAAIDRALALAAEDLPAQLGPWQQINFEAVERDAFSDFGKYSRAYIYRHASRPQLVATVSLDFPYIGGWHDLCVCYRNGGWNPEERLVTEAGKGEHDWPYVDARLASDERGDAVVLFAGFDVSGAAAEPPSDAVLFRPWFRLRRRLLHELAPQLFQVQVFAAGPVVDDPDVRNDLTALFQAARPQLRQHVAPADPSAPEQDAHRVR
ncbi:MAG: hypothetical protein CMJ58_15360 [Planctomycetaceae bacterium]|nr:hypothetical protein [Planctomycetaceae bacterium]